MEKLTLEKAKELNAKTVHEEHLLLHAANVSAAMGVAEFRGAFVGEEGTIEVYAKAEGLAPARLKIKIGNKD